MVPYLGFIMCMFVWYGTIVDRFKQPQTLKPPKHHNNANNPNPCSTQCQIKCPHLSSALAFSQQQQWISKAPPTVSSFNERFLPHPRPIENLLKSRQMTRDIPRSPLFQFQDRPFYSVLLSTFHRVRSFYGRSGSEYDSSIPPTFMLPIDTLFSVDSTYDIIMRHKNHSRNMGQLSPGVRWIWPGWWTYFILMFKKIRCQNENNNISLPFQWIGTM